VRFLGVDYGRRRVGLALSDDTGTLARPWRTLLVTGAPRAVADAIGEALDAARADVLDTIEIGAIVLGLPRRLNGEDTDQTAVVRQLAGDLRTRTGVPVHLQDERLTSREAESRLAERERDWRARKARLDAAAAAIILQDYLDSPAAALERGITTSD